MIILGIVLISKIKFYRRFKHEVQLQGKIMKTKLKISLNILVTTPLLSLSTITHSQTDPANLDLFCSGALFRSTGLIKENINRFTGDARSQMLQVANHMENNGNLLMLRGIQGGGKADSTNSGMAWANTNVGSNVLVILEKGTKQNSVLMDCLRRTNK